MSLRTPRKAHAAFYPQRSHLMLNRLAQFAVTDKPKLYWTGAALPNYSWAKAVTSIS
jgi:hypothetical protein